MRSSLLFHLAAKRGRSYLQNHESGVQSGIAHEKRRQLAGLRVGHLLDTALGNSRECNQRNRKLVRSHRQRLAMKISAADYFAGARGRIWRDKHEGIVSRAV